MKLTKYQHACFSVEKDGKLLLMDPGIWTNDLPALENVVGIVITHEHPDHFDVNAIGAIVAHNPDARVYAHESITAQLGDAIQTHAVQAGDAVACGPFGISFHGGAHEIIHDSLGPVVNLAVMIDTAIYYPGDSFAKPNAPIDILALPVAAPWLKLSEAIDFVSEVQPRFVFPTHDAVASDIGKQLLDTMIPSLIRSTETSYARLKEPLEFDERSA